MNHLEFHQAVAVIAAGKYFKTECGATNFGADLKNKTRIDWRAYTETHGWTREYGTPAEVIGELVKGREAETKLEDIGTSPTAAPFEAVAPVDSYVDEAV